MTLTESEMDMHRQLLCSVIIPVYNSADLIERCLDGVGNQTLAPNRYEIIVVDDGSQDATAAVATAWGERHPDHALTVILQENSGPGAARNCGAQAAQSPLLFFTDGDCSPLPGWATALAEPFQDPDVIGAKGAYVTEQTGLAPRFVQAEYEDRYDRMYGLPQIDFIDTYSAAYRRDVFLENGGFHTYFTTVSMEDQELSFRLTQKGYRLLFAPEAKVSHLHDADIGEYFRRKYNIGYWKAMLIRWYPERMVQDSHTPQVLKVQIVLMAAMLGLLPFALLGIAWKPLLWTWSAIGLIALIFLISGLPFLAKLAHRSWALAVFGSLMLAIRAVALGGGYLSGAIHFAGTAPGGRRPAISGWKRFIKRGIDILGALIGLLISIPLVAIAALAIKLDSPGPIFYWQVRIGENGLPFRIAKLRSMVRDADAQLDQLIDLDALDEPVYKIADDPRVTRVGRVLRRTSLDEAPQFYNVLKGDMSLVGPRPEDARIVAMYTDKERRRLAIKPGMTGPMQVSGRGSLGLNNRLRLELDYIDNYSLMRDLKILLRTLPAIFHGNGAY